MSYPFAPLNITLRQHGEINHTPANYHLLEPTSKWYAQQFANFLVELDGWKEAGGTTVLDNTLFWYTYEHENAGAHSHGSIPMILAGSGGGSVRTGRYIQYMNKPHNDLLAAIANVMGVPTTKYGDARVATGVLPGLT